MINPKEAMSMKSHTKADLILILVLLATAAAFWGFRQFQSRSASPSMAQISVNGTVVETLPLDQDTQITIQGYQGGSNTIIIQDGQVWCSQADCPDKLCVSQGKKSLATDTIVCLPHRVTVTILEP